MTPGAGAEINILRDWIAAGMRFPAPEPRPFRDVADVLGAVARYLKGMDEPGRKYQRFFTLTELYNNDRDLTADDLRVARAALAKAVNSLSGEPAIVVPRAIDADETVFAVDLRALGWVHGGAWATILKAYPYGVSYDAAADDAVRSLAGEVRDLSGTDLPCVRGDWLIATATRPPLYHALLGLPTQATELERRLGVEIPDRDPVARFNDPLNPTPRARLAGGADARHIGYIEGYPQATGGSYWKTYLLGPAGGPQFVGSAIHFTLPNGLRGYMIVDGDGRRLDAAPEEVMRDPLKTAGTAQVVAGVSCLACHKVGAQRILAKTADIPPVPHGLEKTLADDEARFLGALERATGVFRNGADDRDESIRDFPEPIGPVARHYAKDLGLEDVATELGFEDAPGLLSRIRANDRLTRDVAPLLRGGTIGRDSWQAGLFERVVTELRLGTIQKVFYRPSPR
jgi:hypothetical protein